jgi:hypothetical protein
MKRDTRTEITRFDALLRPNASSKKVKTMNKVIGR